MGEQDQTCPHCGAVSAAFTESCTGCGRRLTCVTPETRLHRVLRAPRLVKPSDALGENPAGVGEAYRHGPMNHSEHA